MEKERNTNHYVVLDVGPEPSAEEVRAKFHEIASECHPDRNPSEAAHVRFMAACEAARTLRDPARKRKYDELLRMNSKCQICEGRLVRQIIKKGVAGSGPCRVCQTSKI